MRSAVGGTRLVLNREAPIPVGGREKYFEMGERFVNRLPLVPLSAIGSKNDSVEKKLVGVVHALLVQVGCGACVGVCNGVIVLLPDDLDGIGGSVCLS